jgi:hypothetical protein
LRTPLQQPGFTPLSLPTSFRSGVVALIRCIEAIQHMARQGHMHIVVQRKGRWISVTDVPSPVICRTEGILLGSGKRRNGSGRLLETEVGRLRSVEAPDRLRLLARCPCRLALECGGLPPPCCYWACPAAVTPRLETGYCVSAAGKPAGLRAVPRPRTPGKRRSVVVAVYLDWGVRVARTGGFWCGIESRWP